MKTRIAFLIPAFLIIPFRFVSADVGSFREVVLKLVTFLSRDIMPVLVTLGVLYFLYNLTEYIRKSDNEKEQQKFGPYVGWSLLALFVMLAVWGIVGILVRSVFPDGTVFVG
jgi:uncharacterized membrane protein